MNYTHKTVWKLILFIIAAIIGAGSLFYTNRLVSRLAKEERKRVQLWAQATRELQNVELGTDISPIYYDIIKGNRTIPLVFVDEHDNIITTANLDANRTDSEEYLQKQLKAMKSENDPIVIEFGDDTRRFIYYKDSTLLKKLTYYPFIQIGVISLFIFVAYLAFSSSRNAEQNQVWVGLTKETAHQLGTPISSLLAWNEMLKLKLKDDQMQEEVEKDLDRLQKITDRFSKIGSSPDLYPTDLNQVVLGTINYLKTRTSGRVRFVLHFAQDDAVVLPLNASLFQWVIENLCKNSIDAMGGMGKIEITLTDQVQVVYIDVKDSGKGIPKSKYKAIFRPGYTSKKTGWGLGLSLTKRIVEYYHRGKIFVKSSEVNQGTTIRIVLNKSKLQARKKKPKE